MLTLTGTASGRAGEPQPALSMLARAQDVPLAELVDGLALSTGAWVVVERLGIVVSHGPGQAPCPAALATTLVSKHTLALRTAVSWQRGGTGLTGVLEGLVVGAQELGDGATVWFVGSDVGSDIAPDAAPRIAAALLDEGRPVVDPVVEELLHPRGPSRGAPAPAAQLIFLQSTAPLTALGRAAQAATSGISARVHTLPDGVLVAADPDADLTNLLGAVRGRCPDAVLGATSVEPRAVDWRAAARTAAACARVAVRLGRSAAHAGEPPVAAELVVTEAQDAALALMQHLPHPLRLLQEHDDRGGDLLPTLTAWCRVGFDVTAAAAALHVHTNTLRYRLRRAAAISGLDLDRPRHLLTLQLLLTV